MRKPPRTPHIALLIETSLASGRDMLRGIARYVREHHSWGLYHEAHGLTERVPEWISRWKGDGIIARIQSSETAAAITQSGLPVVDVLGAVAGAPFPLVHVDNRAIAQMAAEHLKERGLQHFAYFGIQGESWSEERRVAFRWATCGSDDFASERELACLELPRDAMNRRSWESVERRIAHWVEKLPTSVGVLVGSDQRGPQFLEACRRAGLSVPDQIAVIGVDNDEPLCDVCAPPLSSIDPNHAAVGYAAAALMDTLLRGGSAPSQPTLIAPVGVVARLSTEMMAVNDPVLMYALKLIRQHAHEGLGVDVIARRVGASRSVLQRRFRQILKRSVHDLILSARIRQARELLAKTDLPLAVVAERAGFKHQAYMGAVFTQRIGVTPAGIRAKRAIAIASGLRPKS